MTNTVDFESIRPYNDSEIHEVFERLKQEKPFLKLIDYMFPNLQTKDVLHKLLSIESINQFQNEIMQPFVHEVVNSTTKGITDYGLKELDTSKHYLFISNHRDIVLDPAILNFLLVKNGFETSEIAIGDNLLIFPWITDLVKLNKTFIVKRNLPGRQMLESSTILSRYIRHTITERKQNIWIAQREGRSKDGDDKTQISLLKMLNISGESTTDKNFEQLNIVPVSISYEYDPCDYLKAHEFFQKRENPDFSKTQEDDLHHMSRGIRGRKGRVHFSFGKPLSESLHRLENEPNKNEQIQLLAEIIDEQIHNNYKLWAGNFVAIDILEQNANHSEKYTDKDKELFINYIEEHLSRIEGDKQFLRNTLLEMYANPVKNFYKE